MFEALPYTALQHYWYAIVSFLGAFLVFMLFVQGGQTMIYSLGRTEQERTLLVNSLGRKWELTFTTLVTFGGAFFASFPLFYSTSFGGAYWVWISILFCFIIQAVSYEYRSKPGNVLGPRIYEIFLFINGALGTILLGTAVATFFTGSEFSVDFKNITRIQDPVISRWQNPLRGIEAAMNIHNLLLGFSVFFLARVLGNLYFINNIDYDIITRRARKSLLINTMLFLPAFLGFVIMLLIKKGFGVDPASGTVFIENFKYLKNLVQMPIVAILFLGGVGFVLYGIIKTLRSPDYSGGLWFTGPGTVLTVFCLFLLAGFNNTAYYPSTYNLQSSLTIANSSSSKFTLVAMSYVSLFVPFVIVYIGFAWRSMNREKISTSEIETNSHVY
jgi:cytochrome d ubiquinol oxidase subunit II